MNEKKSPLWEEQSKTIKTFFQEHFSSHGKKFSHQALADYLDASKGRIQAWFGGQRPNADDLQMLSERFGFSPKWLLLGKGTPFEQEPAKHTYSKASIQKPETELGKQLAEIEAALRKVGASDEEIRKAMIAHVGAGKTLEDEDAAQQEPAKASTATS
ncbi:hypothetical protein [Oleidesulfovibrio sp.]|uniref:hypothetical protein n=1 Tax=Oleidesulfovibrio sp. TaxID=2909707 RepID=UPI003A86B5D2